MIARDLRTGQLPLVAHADRSTIMGNPTAGARTETGASAAIRSEPLQDEHLFLSVSAGTNG